MKIPSFYQQVIRTVQFSLAALICSVALNFGTAPSLAAQVQLPTSQLAIFGWGEKAEGKAEEIVGKVQANTGKKLEGNANQLGGRAKSDLGRVEDRAERAADKAGQVSKDIKKGIDKNLSRVGNSTKDTANNLVDGAKKMVNN